METEDLIHAIILFILIFVGLILSGIYLISVKSTDVKAKINATDVLQIIKTVLVIMGLTLFMPLEVVSVVGLASYHQTLCVVRGMLENMLLECQPMATLAIAITRFRVSICMGNSAILITKSSACITLFVCLLFPSISSVVTLVSSLDPTSTPAPHLNSSIPDEVVACIGPPGSFSFIHRVLTLVSLDILPITITCCLYVIIYLRLLVSKPSSNSTHKQKFESEIRQTILVLIAINLVSWLPYIAVSAQVLVFESMENEALRKVSIYIKMALYILHPFSEGLLQKKRKKNLKMSCLRFCNRSKVGCSVDTDKTTHNKSGVVSISERINETQFSGENINNFSNSEVICDTIISAVVYTTCEERHSRDEGGQEMSPSHPSILIKDDVSSKEIPTEDDSDLSDIHRGRFGSSLRVSTIETNDTRPSLSTESQRSNSSSCSSRTISKVSSISSSSGRSQIGRGRHSLWRVQSSKNLWVAASDLERKTESPTFLILEGMEEPIMRSDSVMSDVSEYF